MAARRRKSYLSHNKIRRWRRESQTLPATHSMLPARSPESPETRPSARGQRDKKPPSASSQGFEFGNAFVVPLKVACRLFCAAYLFWRWGSECDTVLSCQQRATRKGIFRPDLFVVLVVVSDDVDDGTG